MKKLLLENIAKKVAENFEEIGDISVPQIEQLRNLNKEETNIFVKSVQTYCKNGELGEGDIERIQRQLNGDTVEEWENLKRILEKMKNQDREEAVRKFLQELKGNENKTQKQKELDKVIADIGIYIKKMPNEKQLSTAKTIVNALEQQQEAIDMWKKHKNSGIVENKVDTKRNEREKYLGENR